MIGVMKLQTSGVINVVIAKLWDNVVFLNFNNIIYFNYLY